MGALPHRLGRVDPEAGIPRQLGGELRARRRHGLRLRLRLHRMRGRQVFQGPGGSGTRPLFLPQRFPEKRRRRFRPLPHKDHRSGRRPLQLPVQERQTRPPGLVYRDRPHTITPISVTSPSLELLKYGTLVPVYLTILHWQCKITACEFQEHTRPRSAPLPGSFQPSW